MNEVKDLFRDEVVNELRSLETCDLDADETKHTMNAVSMLADKLIKMEELDLRAKEIEADRAKTEVEAKKADIEERKIEVTKKDNNMKNGIAIGTAVAGVLVTVAFGVVSLIADGKGVLISTDTGRKTFNRGLDYFFRR
jgi:hypothetical protein